MTLVGILHMVIGEERRTNEEIDFPRLDLVGKSEWAKRRRDRVLPLFAERNFDLFIWSRDSIFLSLAGRTTPLE